MKLTCIAISKIPHEIPQVERQQLLNVLYAKMEFEVATVVSKLLPFGINPTTSIEQRIEEYSDLFNVTIYAKQKVFGHWLKFLHARRAGVIPKFKSGKYIAV